MWKSDVVRLHFLNRSDISGLNEFSRHDDMAPQSIRSFATCVTRRRNVVVVGGGIVGTATAMTLQRAYPNHRVTLLEKEKGIGRM